MQFALPRKYRQIFVSRVFSAFCDAGVAHFIVFFFLQLHSCVRTTDAKKWLCNLNFAAQIISSKFVIGQKLRYFKVLLAMM
jgi:hypothetical protein